MSNMIKRAFVKVEGTEKLMIDSNSLVSDKMEEIISSVPEEAESLPEGFDEFTEGLMADKVEMLTSDDQGEGEGAEALSPSNVMRNDSPKITEEMMEVARAEADRIMSEADEQAAKIIADAEANAAAVTENARNEGFSAGHDEGYNAGYQEAEALKQECEQLRQSLENEFQAKFDELEPLFVETLTGIYEHVFHVDLSGNKDVIFYLIQNAVRNAEVGDGIIIHVSKEDFSHVSLKRDELLNGVINAENVEIVEDMTLKENECFIDTGGGIFDCSLDTELEGLRRELMLLSYEKPSRADAEGNG